MGALRIVTSWTSLTRAGGGDRSRPSGALRSRRPARRTIRAPLARSPAVYDLQLESARARGFDLPKGVFLVGNYVAGIGLPMVLEQAAAVATQIREMA